MNVSLVGEFETTPLTADWIGKVILVGNPTNDCVVCLTNEANMDVGDISGPVGPINPVGPVGPITPVGPVGPSGMQTLTVRHSLPILILIFLVCPILIDCR